MTRRYTQSDDSNELLDLSSIFIGRQQQLDLFQIYLTRWQQRMFDAAEDEPLVTDAPSPNNKLQGLVVMLYGRGGFGKSTLLTHYKSLARQSTPPLTISRTIDWEFAIEGKRSLFNPAPSQEIDAGEYFKLLCAQFALVLDKKVSDFKNYRDAVTEVAHAQKDAERLVDSIQKDDRFAFVRQATGEGLVRLLRLVPVGGTLLKDDKIAEKASEVLRSGAAMTAGQLIHLHNHLKDRLGTKLGDYLNPALKLGLGLGSDLSDFARNHPLLIFFDTYEEVDEGDALLRIVMAAAGLRVGWVLAGRDNLWAGLEHARDNQDERSTLYALALLRRADHPAAVTAALGLTLEQAKTSYSSTLSRLHRRYSFIFTEKDEPALHQEVRHFLRLWLREHRREPEIIAINERLKKAHEDELRWLEEQRMYGTLKDRLQDEEWAGVYLDLTEQQFWLDPVEGVRYILPFMIAAAIYNRKVNKDAAEVGAFFAENIALPYRDWWKWAEESLRFLNNRKSSDEALAGLEKLTDLVESRRCPSFPLSLLDCRAELEVALWWRLGEAYLDRDGNKALGWYEKCLERLSQENTLKEVIARAYRVVAGKSYGEKKYAECIILLNRAIEYKPDDAIAYHGRGSAYNNLKEYQRAIEDCTRAIELDPKLAAAYNNRGLAYNNLKEYQRAIEDYTHALEVDPNYVRAYNNRAFAYYCLKEYEWAIEDYTRALELDPNYVVAYNNRGLAYRHLKEYKHAIEGYTRALELDPHYTSAYSNRGIAHLWLKNTSQARIDYAHRYELDPTNINAGWMLEWIDMGKHRMSIDAAVRLEKITTISPQDYVAYACRGIALGLRSKLKEGLAELEQAIPLKPEAWGGYFWKGLLCAYYYKGRYQTAIEAIEKALEVGLPPILLTPLYWLEKDRPDFFEQYAKPLLEKYEV